MRKVIVVNASTVLTGGGLIVVQDILRALSASAQLRLIVFCPSEKLYGHLRNEYVQIIVVKRWMLLWAFRWFLDYIWLPKQTKKYKPNLVLSLGNLPGICNNYQVFCNDNAFITAASSEIQALPAKTKIIHGLRKWVFKRRTRFVDKLIVQNKLEKERMSRLLKNNCSIDIITPLIPEHLLTIYSSSAEPHHKKKVHCLSPYAEHKNFEFIIELAIQAKRNEANVCFYITVNELEKDVQKMLNSIKKEQLDEFLINLGIIPVKKIKETIMQCDALILPSYVESFSLNCIEAWYCNKVLFIKDAPYSRNVCGNSAAYINTNSATEAFNLIENVLHDEIMCNNFIQSGQQQLLQLSKANDWLQLIHESLSE